MACQNFKNMILCGSAILTLSKKSVIAKQISFILTFGLIVKQKCNCWQIVDKIQLISGLPPEVRCIVSEGIFVKQARAYIRDHVQYVFYR